MKTAFIGHREIFSKDIRKRLANAIQTEIDSGCKFFTMGTRGDFDSLALSACRKLRQTYRDVEIEVVLTSLHTLEKKNEWDIPPYGDVDTVIYDIEAAHFKRHITLSNRLMIDSCDTLICYVDVSAKRSGAKTALRYAERKGLRIINLYRAEDKFL